MGLLMDRRTSVVLLITFFANHLRVEVRSHSVKESPLLLISFDGFRYDYLSRTNTPNFEKVIKNGVHARRGVKNVFVTNTLPNHWSMVTGLYPESHGVIDNKMRDPKIERQFIPKYVDSTYMNDLRYYDDGGEPIWVTNQMQKEDGRSGSIMWWGSDNPVKWIEPTFSVPYDRNTSPYERIDTIVKWFKLQKPINLGLLYFSEPDEIAHKTGPDSNNVTDEIVNADSYIGYLFHQLGDLVDHINIIITSDHGFVNVSRDKVINLDTIDGLQHEDYEMTSHTPLASFFPKEGKLETVYSALKTAANQPGSQFRVFRAEEIPERFHFRNNPRVPPIVALANLSYSFIYNMSIADFTLKGNHGYDNDISLMHPFFMAMGPSFKKGVVIETTFNSVDIYPLMCKLLGLSPAPNNGSLAVVSQLLEEAHENTVWTFGTYILVLIVIASIGGIFTVAACRQHRYLKRKISQLKSLPPTLKYYKAPKSGINASLLSEEDEDEDDDFDDAKDDDRILEILTDK